MAIELPNGKICRNLPEQVGENAKNIKEIQDLLDGLNIQDNLVVIADLSQILNAEELEVVERPVAFLYYNNQLYIKKNESAGVAYFDVIFTIAEDSGEIEFSSQEIEVNLTTGALSYASSSSYTYTKSHIDTELALKANDAEVAKLTGAAFTGGITSPSIIEDMSGYSFTPNTAQTNHTKVFKYVSAVKNGNKVTLVVFVEIQVGGSQINAGSGLNIGTFALPAAVMNSLYPVTQGVYTNSLGVFVIQLAKATSTVPNPSDTGTVLMNKDPSGVFFYIYTNSNLTASTSYYARIETTFLLSDSLVP